MTLLRFVVTVVATVALLLPADLQARSPVVSVSVGTAFDTLPDLPEADLQQGHGWGRKVLTALGGAAVGAGLGYFASQVMVGDWDEDGNPTDRGVWVGTGGAVGLAVGFAVGPAARRKTAAPGVVPPWRQGLGRAVLMAEEIEASSARTVYELIDTRRPEWLILRGTTSWRETRGTTISGTAAGRDLGGEESAEADPMTLKVYLDGVLLGGVEELRTLDVSGIASIHRLDPSQATARWGTGHANGAILIVTEG